MRNALTLVSVAGIVSFGGVVQAQALDTAAYHGGPVLSPTIKCLMWSPASGGFTSTDKATYEEWINGMREYLANEGAHSGTNGAGSEPVPRQYGVWGAYFGGSCKLDSTAPAGPIDLRNNGTRTVIDTEIQTALGPGAYGANTIVLIFTKVGSPPAPGWAYALPGPNDDDYPRHWSLGTGQYIAAVPTDRSWNYNIAAHELIEASTRPGLNANGWYTDPHAINCGNDVEICDDGDGALMTLQYPFSDGYGSSSNPAVVVDSIDDIDGLNNGPGTYACLGNSSLSCSYIGNHNNCGALISGYAFTSTTTTPPVVALQTGSKTNVIARTPTGIVHLVSSDNGASYTVVSPAPGGAVSEVPSVYSKDGTTIDMWGRGYDGVLYHWVYSGSSWSGPNGLGGQLTGPPSAVYGPGSPGTQQDFVYALGVDGNLATWSGGWYSVAMPPNVWAISPPQVFIRDSSHTCADIYFTGSDGKVYFGPCGGAWQTLPGSGSVNGFGLVNTVVWPNSNRVDVFVKEPVGLGGSATLWSEYQSGSLVNHGLLSALPNSVGQVGAVKAPNTAIWLFFTYNNQMYGVSSNSTGTSYTNFSQISGTPLVTSPVTAFAPTSSITVAFARRQSDGHLIQLRWVGTSLQPVADLGVAIM